jgi:hypothetical protein
MGNNLNLEAPSSRVAQVTVVSIASFFSYHFQPTATVNTKGSVKRLVIHVGSFCVTSAVLR